MGTVPPKPSSKMRSLILLLTLTLVQSGPAPMDEIESSVNEVMDVVESSLSDEVEGRALFITLNITQATTSTYTATMNTTSTASCYTTTAAITNCTTSARALEPEGSVSTMESQVVTRSDGKAATLADIMPTKPLEHQADHKMNAMPLHLDANAFDGIVYQNNPLQSGRIEWQEVKAEGLSGCGRSGNRRPRIVIPQIVSSTVNFTSTSTSTATAAATVTFTVLPSCTTAGFSFAVPAC